MADDLTNPGLNISTDSVDRMDEFMRKWDRLEDRRITRSDVAREVIPLGLEVWEALLREYGTEAYRIPTRERNAMVRQAMVDFFDEDDGE